MFRSLALIIACVFFTLCADATDKEQSLSRPGEIESRTTRSTTTVLSSSYSRKIALAIKSNIALYGEIEGNPEAVVRIETETDGQIKGRELVKSSGAPDWDAAVLKAVDKTIRFPLEDTEVLPKFVVVHFVPKERVRSPRDAVQEYLDVGASLNKLLSQSAEASVSPSNERLEPLVVSLTDYGIFTTVRNTEDPALTFIAICGAANSGLGALMDFGLNSNDSAKVVDEMLSRNVGRFQGPMLRLMSFLAPCNGSMLSYAAQTLERRQGKSMLGANGPDAARMREGARSFLQGALLTIFDARFDEKSRQLLLTVITEAAPIYAESVTNEDRQQFRTTIEARLSMAPIQYRLGLRRFLEAMRIARCNAICAG